MAFPTIDETHPATGALAKKSIFRSNFAAIKTLITQLFQQSGGVKFLTSDEDQTIDVSDEANYVMFRTGSGWSQERTITFVGVPQDGAKIEVSNNSGHDIFLTSGQDDPLDIPLDPFRIQKGTGVTLQTNSATSKLIKTKRWWETSSSRVPPFGGSEGDFLGKLSDSDHNFDWLGINDLDLGTVDGSEDYVMFWDATDGKHKRLLVDDLPGGSGASALADLSDVDATVGSPTDGNILVYRSAGSDWVLEAKPADGADGADGATGPQGPQGPQGPAGPAGPGSGDMLASTYDPTTVSGDAFDMANMVEAADAKILTAAERTKLTGIATGATANATDAQLRDRTTHTGAQAISTVTGLQTALDGKAAASHTHTESDITDLGSYALVSHTHTESDITDLGSYATLGAQTFTGLQTFDGGIEVTTGPLDLNGQRIQGARLLTEFNQSGTLGTSKAGNFMTVNGSATIDNAAGHHGYLKAVGATRTITFNGTTYDLAANDILKFVVEGSTTIHGWVNGTKVSFT